MLNIIFLFSNLLFKLFYFIHLLLLLLTVNYNNKKII